MSVSLYQTGISGLLAAQQQLATTGHNIANVNTEGYSRQRAEQDVYIGQNFGGKFLGSGTYIDDVVRVYNEFSYKEQLSATSSMGSADASYSRLSQLNEVMSFSGKAINTSINQFYQAMNGIADNPIDAGLRDIALGQAQVLSGEFQALNTNFDQMQKAVNGEIEQIAAKISDIAVEISKLNETIQFSSGGNLKGQPNDLLDSRDRLVSELGKYTNVNTVVDQSGIMTVMIGQGSTLVAGITPLRVEVSSSGTDALESQLLLVGKNSQIALNGDSLGGELGAKINFRDQDLKQTRNEIDRLAMAISSTLNDAQANGLDLNQKQGTNLFSDINTLALQQGRITGLASNTGNLDARIEITDVSKIPTDEYLIRYDGVDYIMTNLADNTSTTLVQSPANTYDTGLGFNFVVDAGAAAADDSFVIRPTKNSAAFMEVALKQGASIAASSAVEIRTSDNNISPGKIEIVDMLDPEQARLAMPMRIDVLESPVGVFNYTYTDNLGATSAPIAYTPPSQQISLPPAPSTPYFTIEIEGTPSGNAPFAPEQFFIEDAFGTGNSANALAMALTQEKAVINGEKETFTQSLSVTTAQVGSKTNSAELVSRTAEALFTQAYNRNQETSGVNLDEEAANLLKFQQAYQAASQIISTANTLFDTLLSVAR